MVKMFKKLTILFTILTISGCASVGTHYKWKEYKTTKCKRNILLKKTCEEVDRIGWVPTDRYRCTGVGCKVDFEKRTMEGGQAVDLSGLQLKNQ